MFINSLPPLAHSDVCVWHFKLFPLRPPQAQYERVPNSTTPLVYIYEFSSLWKILKVFKKILKVFKKIHKVFKKILKVFKKILKVFKKILKVFKKILKVLKKILKVFKKILKVL